jgi:hypothetical protein
MTERTVTEQQVIDAMNKFAPETSLAHYGILFDELFPDLPKVGELIDVNDTVNPMPYSNWRPFHHIGYDGRVFTGSIPDGTLVGWQKTYRRQTPTERGEG